MSTNCQHICWHVNIYWNPYFISMYWKTTEVKFCWYLHSGEFPDISKMHNLHHGICQQICWHVNILSTYSVRVIIDWSPTKISTTNSNYQGSYEQMKILCKIDEFVFFYLKKNVLSSIVGLALRLGSYYFSAILDIICF